MENFSVYILPAITALFIGVGFLRGIKPFDLFVEGFEQGVGTLFKIAPSVFAMVIAVELFRASGTMECVTGLLRPALSRLGVPEEIIPMAVLRPVSGSGSIALLNDILSRHGPESEIGRISSVICASSETTFYTIAVYYGACGIKNIRYTIIPAVAADVSAAVIACAIVDLMY